MHHNISISSISQIYKSIMHYHVTIMIHMTKCSCTVPCGVLYEYISIMQHHIMCEYFHISIDHNAITQLPQRRSPLTSHDSAHKRMNRL